MKTNKLFNALVVLLLALPLFALTSCSEEDAPEFSHSAKELVDGNAGSTWTWNTVSGDLPDAFEVTIEMNSDTEFTIVNFANVDGDRVKVKMSGTALSFDGDEVTGGIVKGGAGTIKNGWATMDISYSIEGEDSESFSATLEHEKMISKKAKVSGK